MHRNRIHKGLEILVYECSIEISKQHLKSPFQVIYSNFLIYNIQSQTDFIIHPAFFIIN